MKTTTNGVWMTVALMAGPASATAGTLDRWHPRETAANHHISAFTFDSGDRVFVAVDESHPFESVEPPSALLTSTNGINWTRLITGTNHLLTGSIAHGNGFYFSVRYSQFALPGGELLQSTNGTDWTSGFPDAVVRSVQFVNGNRVLAGWVPDGIIICDFGFPCPDPVFNLWIAAREPAPLSIPLNPFFPEPPSLIRASVAQGNGRWVVIGWAAWGDPFTPSPRQLQLLTWSSSDGTHFVRGPSLSSGMATLPLQIPDSLRVNVVHGEGRFVVVNGTSRLFTSTDGANWEANTNVVPDAPRLNDVAFGNGQFVAVGDSGAVVSSTDGLHWNRHSSGTNVTLREVEYGNYTFVAIGGTNTVLQSDPIVSLRLNASATQLALSAPPQSHYRIEYATDVDSQEPWQMLTNLIVLEDPFTLITEPTPPRRFYRAVMTP